MSFKIVVNKLNLISNYRKFINNDIGRQCCYYSSTTKIGVIGAPFCKGQPKPGTDNSPKLLRDMGLLNELKQNKNLIIHDYGDIKYKIENTKPLKNTLNYPDVYFLNKMLALKIQEILNENDQYLLLGGDHSIGLGSLAGHLAHDPNVSVIWIDAHADLNTNLSSVSGNIHGMPLSMVINELKHYYTETDISKIVKNYLPVKNLYYIGLRDVELFEYSFIKEQGIKAFGMTEIEKLGIPKVVEMILDLIGKDSNIHISFDVDSLDPTIAPSTGTRVSGGLTLREIFYTLEKFHDTGKVKGFDIAEINPLIGDKHDVEKTVKTGIEAIKIIMGHKRLQE